MRISRELVAEIAAHGRGGYPFEVCGALVGRGPLGSREIVRVVRLVNHEPDRLNDRYQIDPLELLHLERELRGTGLEVVGFYHTHPDHPARPSETDRRAAADGLSDGVLHMIFGVDRGEHVTPSAWVFRDATQSFEVERVEYTAAIVGAAADAPTGVAPGSASDDKFSPA
jgi:proteasome lid subunit RPN8/RPN11